MCMLRIGLLSFEELLTIIAERIDCLFSERVSSIVSAVMPKDHKDQSSIPESLMSNYVTYGLSYIFRVSWLCSERTFRVHQRDRASPSYAQLRNGNITRIAPYVKYIRDV
jgi:hypothetical protein